MSISHYMNIVEGKVKIAERSGGFDVVGYFRYLKHIVMEILTLKKRQAPKPQLVEKYKEMLELVNNAKIQAKSLAPEQYTDLIRQTNELVKKTGVNTDQSSAPAPGGQPTNQAPQAAAGSGGTVTGQSSTPGWKSQNLPH